VTSSVQPGAALSPWATEPLPLARSIVQVASGFFSLNWKTVFTLSPVPAFFARNAEMPANTSVEFGTTGPAAAPALATAAGLALGLGISA